MTSPPVMPAQPIVPPPQTNMGTMQADGMPMVTSVKPPIDFVTFDSNRLEYLYRIDSSTLKPSDSNLNSWQYAAASSVSFPKPTQFYDRWMCPRDYKFLGTAFHNVDFEITLLAIKPPDTTGKILIEHLPEGRMDMSNTSLADRGSGGLVYKEVWDVGATPVFTFKIAPPNYLSHRPSRTFRMIVSDYLVTCGYNLSWLTPYQNGSIYPDSFTIFVFSRWNFVGYFPMLPSLNSLDDSALRDVQALVPAP